MTWSSERASALGLALPSGRGPVWGDKGVGSSHYCFWSPRSLQTRGSQVSETAALSVPPPTQGRLPPGVS